jgi:hypothetical protein
MVREAASVDVGAMPEVAEFAREVARAGRPVVLHEDGEVLAVISPAPRHRRRKGKTITQADIEASLAAAGSWKGNVDTDRLKHDRRELQEHDRLPPDL